MTYEPHEINPDMPPVDKPQERGEINRTGTVHDFDRGLIIRTHLPSGMDVFMYRNEPGVFMNAFGKSVSDAIAKEAFGHARFDELTRRRQFRQKMKDAERAIEAEMAMVAKIEKRVVRKAAGLNLVDVGNEQYLIEDADGGRLTPQPLPRPTAEKVFDKLVGDESEQAPEGSDPKEQVISVKAGPETSVKESTT